MTDNTERQVRQWANGRNGDPLTPKDVVDLVLAVDADGDARHVETIKRLDDVDQRHITLCLRVSELEQTSIGCSERVKAFVAAEHDTRHTEHMASFHGPERRVDDPPGSEFAEHRVGMVDSEDARHAWAMWWLGGKFGYVVIAVLITTINVAINLLWFGKP